MHYFFLPLPKFKDHWSELGGGSECKLVSSASVLLLLQEKDFPDHTHTRGGGWGGGGVKTAAKVAY